MPDIAWGAAELGTLSGSTITLSGTPADLGAAGARRTFAQAAADNNNPFTDQSTTEITVVVDPDNFVRYVGATYNAVGTLSLVGATLKAAQGSVPNGFVTVYAQILEGDPVGSAAAVQANLDAHEAATNNPHSVTAAQAGADPSGSAAAVQADLDGHKAGGDHDARYAPISHEHDGDEVNIPGGVQGNAVAIDANGKLEDSGVPPGGAGGSTNLGNVPTAIAVEITSSSGSNTTVARATTSVAGVMAGADKTDLDAATAHVAATNNPHSVTAAQAGADPSGSAAAVQSDLDGHKAGGDHDARYAPISHGHDGDEITIPAGVQGNAVSIDANGKLEDSGVPPGGSGGIEDGYTENIAAAPATSGTITIPGTISRVFDIALTGAAILSLGAAPGAGEATIQTLRITHSAGPHNLALPAGVEWIDGTEIAVGGAGTSTIYKISRFGTATAILEGAVASTP